MASSVLGFPTEVYIKKLGPVGFPKLGHAVNDFAEFRITYHEQ
jgi:hypothetical protein